MAKKMAAKPAKKPKIESARGKPRSKSDTLATIAGQTDLTRKQVQSVFETMTNIMAADLKTVKMFQVPGLMKVVRIDKPATRERTVPNPFKPGEMMTVKAKPARTQLKIVALKAFKESL